MNRRPVIYTHRNPDLDSILSVWAVVKFHGPFADARVQFVDANWNGDLADEDLALDIEAGGRGIKGKTSCIMEVAHRFIPEHERQALAELIRFVDIQDSQGSVVQHVLGNLGDLTQEDLDLFQLTGLNMTLAGFRRSFRGDDGDISLLRVMSDLYDGLLQLGLHRLKIREQVAEVEIIGGNVALVIGMSQGVTVEALKQPDVQMAVYANGKNIGIMRAQKCDLPTANEETQEVVRHEGELETWYIDGRGFMFCRGTNKTPSKVKSNVDPRKLAEAASKFLTDSVVSAS